MSAEFRHEADDNCVLLGRYAASSDNFVMKFRDKISVPSSRIRMIFGILILEDGYDM